MTRQDLFERFWRELPVIKFFLGRKNAYELLEKIVRAWQTKKLLPTEAFPDASTAAVEMTDQVSESYGFIWTIVFQGLVSLAIQLLIKWWFESVEVRAAIIEWQGEANHVND